MENSTTTTERQKGAGRPTYKSTKGILALMKRKPKEGINAKYIEKELEDIFTSLHKDQSITFIEAILENKWYTSDNLFSWIVEYSKESENIKVLGSKIREILIGRAKKLGQSSQSFTKYLMESEYGYSKKGDKQSEHNELSASKSAALESIMDMISNKDTTNENS